MTGHSARERKPTVITVVVIGKMIIVIIYNVVESCFFPTTSYTLLETNSSRYPKIPNSWVTSVIVLRKYSRMCDLVIADKTIAISFHSKIVISFPFSIPYLKSILIKACIAQPEGDKQHDCWNTVNLSFGKNAQWWHHCYAF